MEWGDGNGKGKNMNNGEMNKDRGKNGLTESE